MQLLSGEDSEAAATKMQSAFRGYRVRFEQEEELRVQWLNYYMQVGDYEEARRLCMSEEELRTVDTRGTFVYAAPR